MSPALDYSKVAELYDSYVLFEEDIPFFVNECRKSEGPVLELMSGTGRLSIHLIRAGIDLTCTDSSPEMLAVLRRKLEALGIDAPVLQRDVRELGFHEAFSLAILPFQSFGELVGEDDQRAALRSIHAALKAGGTFICTLHNPPARLPLMDRGRVVAGRVPAVDGGGEIVIQVDLRFDPLTRVAEGMQIIERHRPGQALEELVSVPLRFALPLRSSFEELARGCGYSIQATFGDYRESAFAPDTSPCIISFLMRR